MDIYHPIMLSMKRVTNAWESIARPLSKCRYSNIPRTLGGNELKDEDSNSLKWMFNSTSLATSQVNVSRNNLNSTHCTAIRTASHAANCTASWYISLKNELKNSPSHSMPSPLKDNHQSNKVENKQHQRRQGFPVITRWRTDGVFLSLVRE